MNLFSKQNKILVINEIKLRTHLLQNLRNTDHRNFEVEHKKTVTPRLVISIQNFYAVSTEGFNVEKCVC